MDFCIVIILYKYIILGREIEKEKEKERKKGVFERKARVGDPRKRK